uniref:Uncharacterized protein n=1 Tax=Anguilla anguilla TaxID=7936 RepID=A0A0E9WYT3_ANGAN
MHKICNQCIQSNSAENRLKLKYKQKLKTKQFKIQQIISYHIRHIDDLNTHHIVLH